MCPAVAQKRKERKLAAAKQAAKQAADKAAKQAGKSEEEEEPEEVDENKAVTEPKIGRRVVINEGKKERLQALFCSKPYLCLLITAYNVFKTFL